MEGGKEGRGAKRGGEVEVYRRVQGLVGFQPARSLPPAIYYALPPPPPNIQNLPTPMNICVNVSAVAGLAERKLKYGVWCTLGGKNTI